MLTLAIAIRRRNITLYCPGRFPLCLPLRWSIQSYELLQKATQVARERATRPLYIRDCEFELDGKMVEANSEPLAHQIPFKIRPTGHGPYRTPCEYGLSLSFYDICR